MLTEDGKQVRAFGKGASIYFRCPKCDKPNYKHMMYAPLISEKREGPTRPKHEKHEWECDYCGEKLNISVLANPPEWEVTFVEYPEHPKVIREIKTPRPDEPDEWTKSLATSPHEELAEALKDIESVLESVPPEPWLSHAILKMAFSQTISVMEAYLSDTLSYEVLNSDDAIKRLVETDTGLQGMKLRLAEILADQNIARKKIREHLSDIVYHNLPRVAPLYKGALGINIFRDEQRKERLINAVDVRHDIVHRNGKTVNKDYVYVREQEIKALMKDVADLAEDIEFALSDRAWNLAVEAANMSS